MLPKVIHHMTDPPHGHQVAREFANSNGPSRGSWIWLISLDTCLVCPTKPAPIVGYSRHEGARGTTERPE
jgi:hypothetical protein